jgi:hypothetical protein
VPVAARAVEFPARTMTADTAATKSNTNSRFAGIGDKSAFRIRMNTSP